MYGWQWLNIHSGLANRPGSLGIAISEAVEAVVTSNGAKKYSLRSVLNHVLLHQTVIGEEALKQMDMAGEYPHVVFGCVGGGSNFSGIAFPFLRENLRSGQRARLFAHSENILPAPESAHAICAAIDEALDTKEKGEARVILFNLSGHGHFDLSTYDAFLFGSLQDYDFPQQAIDAIPLRLPQVEL